MGYERSEQDFFRRRRELIREMDESRGRALEHQRALASVISRLSPAAAFGFLATEVAGTGESARHRWSKQVSAQQRELERLLFDRIFGLEVRTKFGWSRNYPHPDSPDAPPSYSDLPQFSYRPPTLRQAATAAAPDLVLLVVFNALVLGITVIAFRRYDVR